MKKPILIGLLVLLYSLTNAQTKKHLTNGYSTLQTSISEITQQSILNQIRGVYSTAQRVNINLFAGTLEDSLVKEPSDLSTSLTKKYKNEIMSYFNGIRSFGQANNTVFNVEGLPFSFSTNKNELTFIQDNIFFNYDLNTIKLDADERAKYIIKNVILPSLNNFSPLLNINEIKYFGINVGYKARDFTDDIETALGKGIGEQTSIIISKEVLIKYINSEITDEQVMKMSTFYNCSMNNLNLRLLGY
jgi:hypothetical protein